MYYDHKKVEWLKERYPEGTRICLDQMNDDPFPVESGTLGKVDHVDDIGTVHCVLITEERSELYQAWTIFTLSEKNRNKLRKKK